MSIVNKSKPFRRHIYFDSFFAQGVFSVQYWQIESWKIKLFQTISVLPALFSLFIFYFLLKFGNNKKINDITNNNCVEPSVRFLRICNKSDSNWIRCWYGHWNWFCYLLGCIIILHALPHIRTCSYKFS